MIIIYQAHVLSTSLKLPMGVGISSVLHENVDFIRVVGVQNHNINK